MTLTPKDSRGNPSVRMTVAAEKISETSYRLTQIELGRFSQPSVAHIIDGAFCWVLATDDIRPIDPSICREYAIDQLPEYDAGTQKRRNAEYNERTIAAYRKARRGHKLTGEEKFEMEAAFGPDVTVVNVLTGRRYRTGKGKGK